MSKEVCCSCGNEFSTESDQYAVHPNDVKVMYCYRCFTIPREYKKCCDTCWKKGNNHKCIKKTKSDLYMYYEGGWSDKKDFCSRHEFKD